MNTAWRWFQGVLLGPGNKTLGNIGVTEITDKTDVDDILANSEAHPQWIFKHSTTCPISSGAYRRVVAFLDSHPEEVTHFHLVKVIESRPISLSLADRLGVRHESPQLILLKNGQAVWHTSHGAIDEHSITQAMSMG